MRIAVIEDNDIQLKQTLEWVAAWQRDKDVTGTVRGFRSSDNFLFASEDETFDLLLVDIQMEGTTGIELARKLRASGVETLLAFLTADREFVFDGYKVDALDYLLKPITEQDVRNLLEKASKELGRQKPVWIVETDGELVEVRVDYVSHIEARNHQTVLSTRQGTYTTWETLAHWRESIKNTGFSDHFISPHRSFMINLAWVRRLDRRTIRMANGEEIPIARGRFAEVSQAWLASRRVELE